MEALKNRIDLAEYFAKQGFQTGAEIGVFNGHYSEILCQSIPGLKLYCIDPWIGYKGYRDHVRASSFNEAYETAVKKLAPYNVKVIRKFSKDAVKDFMDGSLDFVYIDGNHQYEYVKEDIEIWTPKVRLGGIVAGDDYYIFDSGNVGVIQAVDEYAKKTNVALQIIPSDKVTHIDHDDRQPQWLFYR